MSMSIVPIKVSCLLKENYIGSVVLVTLLGRGFTRLVFLLLLSDLYLWLRDVFILTNKCLPEVV